MFYQYLDLRESGDAGQRADLGAQAGGKELQFDPMREPQEHFRVFAEPRPNCFCPLLGKAHPGSAHRLGSVAWFE